MGSSIFAGLISIIIGAVILGAFEDFCSALLQLFKDLLNSSNQGKQE